MKHKDFMQLFYDNLSNSTSKAPMYEAYEETEKIMMETEGKRRFANYQVFRTTKFRNKNSK